MCYFGIAWLTWRQMMWKQTECWYIKTSLFHFVLVFQFPYLGLSFPRVVTEEYILMPDD